MPLNEAGQRTLVSDELVPPCGECVPEVFTMPMPRPKTDVRALVDAPMVDEVLRGWTPHLHDHLTEQVWEDGKKRMTSTVLIFCEGGMWKARLNDRSAKLSAWVSAESWEALLETIERGLASESLEWRADRK